MSGNGYLFLTVMSLRGRKSMHGQSLPSFLPTMKKPAPTGEVDGLVTPAASDSLMYFSMAARSGRDRL